MDYVLIMYYAWIFRKKPWYSRKIEMAFSFCVHDINQKLHATWICLLNDKKALIGIKFCILCLKIHILPIWKFLLICAYKMKTPIFMYYILVENIRRNSRGIWLLSKPHHWLSVWHNMISVDIICQKRDMI